MDGWNFAPTEAFDVNRFLLKGESTKAMKKHVLQNKMNRGNKDKPLHVGFFVNEF